MNHADFRIGTEFTTGTGRWRCTDVGTRVIAAIRISGTHKIVRYQAGVRTETVEPLPSEPSWFNGPPYAVAEYVFDEFDQERCAL